MLLAVPPEYHEMRQRVDTEASTHVHGKSAARSPRRISHDRPAVGRRCQTLMTGALE